MDGSGIVFRGVRLGLLACMSTLVLAPAPGRAEAEGRFLLAQAGMMSNQPRTDRPAAPANPAPAIVAPRPPANIVQPPAGLATGPAAAAPAVPAGPFSLSQNAVGYTAANLRFSIGPTTYVVPTADIRGTSLGKDELASLLDPGSATPVADRIARLSASEIVIPEMRAETMIAAGTQAAIYRDIRLSNVGAGRIASATAASGSFEGSGPEGPSRGTFARTEMSELDIGLMMALLNGGGAGSTEMRRIYGSFSIEGMTTEGPKGARARIARLAGRDFKAKPTAQGWIAAINSVPAKTDLNTASPDERSRIVTAFADMLDSFEIGSVEATGMEFSDKGGKDAAGRISRIGYASGPTGSEFRIEGIDVGGEDGHVRIANFSIGGISLSPMLQAGRELAGKSELTASDMRRLVPIIASIRLSGIEVDTKGDPKKREAPMKVSLGVLELLADKPVESIPTDLRLNIRNLSVPIAAAAKDETAKQLVGLGYDKIDASLTANFGWNEPGQELVIRELSTEAAGMGSIGLRGVIGNVTRDVFNPDQALAAIAWMGATARSLDIIVQNGGLFERLLARQAAEKKRSVDDLRREYGMTAAVGIPVMLGNSAAAKALGQAVARFVAKPGRLSVQARARDAGGLGVADFAAAADPISLLDKVELNATAE
jgi:hypothetical protein